MGCLSEVLLGNNLTFSICTHDPDTGVLTDADDPPPYRIYEGLTTPPILTGTMARLDDANTTGFYAAQIACTTANGFEVGKTYSIYIEAPVESDTGGIPYTFGVYDTVRATAAQGASLSGEDIEIKRGDSWSQPIEGLGDISGREKLWFSVKRKTSDEDDESIIQIEETDGLLYLNAEDASARAANGSITVDDEVAGNITIALEEIETAVLVPQSALVYDVQELTDAGRVTTITEANVDINSDVTRAIS